MLFVSDYQMKLNADPRKICSSFKDHECLKVFLAVFLTCVHCADEPSFFLIHTKVQPKVSSKNFISV